MDTSIWKRWLLRSAVAVSVAVALVSCSANKHKDTASGTTESLPGTTVVAGTVAKGLMAGAQVSVYRIGSAGPESTPLATTKTKADGSYTLDIQPTSAPLLIEVRTVSGTRMLNDVKVEKQIVDGFELPTFQWIDAPADLVLRAVIPMGDAPVLSGAVNLLTDLSAEMAASAKKADGSSAAWSLGAITGAMQVAQMLAPVGLDPTEVIPSWDDPKGYFDDSVRMGVLLTRLAVMSSWCGSDTTQPPTSDVDLTLTPAKLKCLRENMAKEAAITVGTTNVTVTNIASLGKLRKRLYDKTAMGTTMEAQFQELLAVFNADAVAMTSDLMNYEYLRSDQVVATPLLRPTAALAKMRLQLVLAGLNAHLARVETTLSQLLSLSSAQTDAFKVAQTGLGKALGPLLNPVPCDPDTSPCTVTVAGAITTYKKSSSSALPRYVMTVEDQAATDGDGTFKNPRQRSLTVKYETSTGSTTVATGNVNVAPLWLTVSDWADGSPSGIRLSGTLTLYGTGTSDWIEVTIKDGVMKATAPQAASAGSLEITGSLKVKSTVGLSASGSAALSASMRAVGPSSNPAASFQLDANSPQAFSLEASVLDKDNKPVELLKASMRMVADKVVWTPAPSTSEEAPLTANTLDMAITASWLGIGQFEASIKQGANAVTSGLLRLQGYAVDVLWATNLATSKLGSFMSGYLFGSDGVARVTAIGTVMESSTLTLRSFKIGFGAMEIKTMDNVKVGAVPALMDGVEFDTIMYDTSDYETAFEFF